MDAAGWAFAAGCGAIAGLVTGPFVAVITARIAAAGPALQTGGAWACRSTRLRPADLIPLEGWLRRRGRCRACGAAHGARFLALELATAVLFAVMALRFGFSPLLPAAWYLAAVGAALFAIDVEQHRLPDALTLPSYLAAIVVLGGGGLLLPGGLHHLAAALIGMVAAGGFFLLLAVLQPAGIGWGDVKLSGVLGFYLGWFGIAALIAGLFAAFALTALTGLALMVAGRASRKSHLPLGAFMVAAALAVIAVGGLVPALS